MKKTPTIYARHPHDRKHVNPDQRTPGCEWVFAGEGAATRKWDGTCVMLDSDGTWWARREVRPGKTPPPGWRMIGDPDPNTGKSVGWEPIEQSPFVKFWREATELAPAAFKPGTYELIGPKINGNPEAADRHRLEPHADAERIEIKTADGSTAPTPDPLDVIFVAALNGWEGVVWHHPDGRMAKLKVRDLEGWLSAVAPRYPTDQPRPAKETP